MADLFYTTARAKRLDSSYAAAIAREAARLESLAMLVSMARGYRTSKAR